MGSERPRRRVASTAEEMESSHRGHERTIGGVARVVSTAEEMESLRHMFIRFRDEEVPVAPAVDGEPADCGLGAETVSELVAAALDRVPVDWLIERVVAWSFLPGVIHVYLSVGGLGTAELRCESREELAARLETLRSRLISTAWSCPSCGVVADVLGEAPWAREGWSCGCGTTMFAPIYSECGHSPASSACWPVVAQRLAELPGGSGMPDRARLLACVSEVSVPVEELFSGVSCRAADSHHEGALVPVFAIAPGAHARDFAKVPPRVQASLGAADLGLSGYSMSVPWGSVTFDVMVWAARVIPRQALRETAFDVELSLPFDEGRPLEVALSRRAFSPVGGDIDGEAVGALLAAARARIAAWIGSRLSTGPDWKLLGDLPYSVDGGIEPAVPLSLQATGRLGAFDDISAARTWVAETLQFACSTFARAEGELADLFGYAVDR